MKGKTICPKCSVEFVADIPEGKDTHIVTCPKCKQTFTIKRICKDEEKKDCGWEEHGEPRKTILSSLKHNSNKPMFASFFLLAVGILGLFTSVVYWSSEHILFPELEGLISNLPGPVTNNVLVAVFLLVFSCFAFIGALTSFQRRFFCISLLCAVLGVFSIGLFVGIILSLIALGLIISARDEFENGTQGKVF